MAIVKMKRLRLFGMRADRERLLHLLQRLGCVEIGEPAIDLSDPEWAALAKPDGCGLAQAKEQSVMFDNALSTLKTYDKAKGGLFQTRPEVSEGELFDDDAYAAAQEAARAVLEGERTVAALTAEKGKLQLQKAALAPWLPLDVPMEMTGNESISLIFGTVPAKADFAAVEAAVAEVTDLASLYYSSADRDFHYFLLMCHVSGEEASLEALRSFGFARANLRGWSGTAADNDRMVDNQLAVLEEKLKEAREQIAAYAPQRDMLRRCADRAAQDAAREEAKGHLIDTDETFFLEGWITAESEEELAEELGGFTCAWEARDPAPEEYPEVPVKLKNNALTRPMNMVTEMYSLPAYDGIDPNPLMAPFFILFYGMMMADMGYGLLMMIASLVVTRKAKPRGMMDYMFRLAGLCGITTFLFGAVTGGFFGDFIPQLIKIINPASTFEMPALFNPVDDTLMILLGSLALGVVQIVTGMVISLVRKVKEGDYLSALFEEVTWWLILGGLVLTILGVTPVVLVLGGVLLVAGCAVNGYKKGKTPVGTVLGTIVGTFVKLGGSLYNNITGYFQDILSYSRLMALMLSGAVVAQVFNTLGAIPGNVIFFIIISLVGNALNMALNILGCYVHDLRLQCLEFFNRFYKDGGRAYKPLEYKTQYIDIKK